MALEVLCRKNNLFINGKPMKFDYEVGNAFVVDNKIVFLLRIPNGDPTLKNIYCLSEDCQFLWQVQSQVEAFPEVKEELPFEGMTLRENGNISAYDFFGRDFDIDPTTGKILSFKVTR